MITTYAIHDLIDSYVQTTAGELKQSLTSPDASFTISSKTWSNNAEIVTGYLTIFPNNNPAEQSIDAVISFVPLDDSTQLSADICWSDGPLLIDILEKEINFSNMDELLLDLNPFCQTAFTVFLQKLPELAIKFREQWPQNIYSRRITMQSATSIVREYFSYLFDRFEIVSETNFESFGNWVVVLVSKKCRVRIMHDRGEVSLAVGPLWSPPSWQAGPWYDLAVMWRYLSLSEPLLETQLDLSIDERLKNLSISFHEHAERVCDLFVEENFKQTEDELNSIKNKLDDAAWNSVL
jgi:hypothetical protein